jgi:hypothetical protein
LVHQEGHQGCKVVGGQREKRERQTQRGQPKHDALQIPLPPARRKRPKRRISACPIDDFRTAQSLDSPYRPRF